MEKLLIIFLTTSFLASCGKNNDQDNSHRVPETSYSLELKMSEPTKTLKLKAFSRIDFIVDGLIQLESQEVENALHEVIKIRKLDSSKTYKCYKKSFSIKTSAYTEITNKNFEEYFEIMLRGEKISLKDLIIKRHRLLNKDSNELVQIQLKENHSKDLSQGSFYHGKGCKIMKLSLSKKNVKKDYQPLNYVDLNIKINASQE